MSKSFLSHQTESQTTFTKKADAALSDPAILSKYIGKYAVAGSFISVELIDKALYLAPPGSPRYQLIPVKSNSFRVKEFPDLRFEFVLENDEVAGFKQIDPSGEYFIEKKK